VIDWNKGKAVEFLLESLGKEPLSLLLIMYYIMGPFGLFLSFYETAYANK
jgi:hypothetical protein